MIKLSPQKIHVIPYQDKDDPDFKFSVSWKFPLSTLPEMDAMRKTFSSEDTKGVQMDKVFMNSIVGQEGFIGEDDKPLDMLNEVHRAAVYDYIKGVKGYPDLVLIAYSGPRSKNLLTGLTPASTGSGDQENVVSAS